METCRVLFDLGPSAASAPVTPEDGVVDLQEEEMEQSVFGKAHTLNDGNLQIYVCLQHDTVLSLRDFIFSHKNKHLFSFANISDDALYTCVDIK